MTPSEFRGVFTPLKTDAWVPMMMQPQVRPGRDLADAPWLRLFGRLGPGADRIAAGRELTAITTEHARVAAEPQGFRSYNTIHVSGLAGLPDDARRAFLGFAGLLLGAAVLVLLIASVNVASIQIRPISHWPEVVFCYLPLSLAWAALMATTYGPEPAG